MSVDLSALPRSITVKVGERAEIALPSYAGSGNRWSARCMGGKAAEVRVEVEAIPPPPPGDGTGPPPPLRLAPEKAVVLGLAPGEAAWRLELSRPFGVREPAATHELRVTVIH